MQIEFSKYEDVTLKELIEKMSKYFFVIELLCKRIKRQGAYLQDKELIDIPDFSLNSIFDEVQEYTECRKQVFIPYVTQLSEKCDDFDYNIYQKCSNQEGEVTFINFSLPLQNVKTVCDYVRVLIEERCDGINDDKLSFLNQIVLLDDILNEIFRIEKMLGFSEMKLAQKLVRSNNEIRNTQPVS